jgi:hypothetical protein
MTTLVYKMTHSGDPDPDLGCWGVANCMGPIRGCGFTNVIGIGGRSWWTGETSRADEIVWIGLGAQKTDVGISGPEVRFTHFRYFREGELMLRPIAPNLARNMRNRRFMLHGFSAAMEQEMAKILKRARNAAASAHLTVQPTESEDAATCRLMRRVYRPIRRARATTC